MLGLIVETLVFGKSTVPAIGVSVWLSCNAEIGISAQQKIARMISAMRMLFRSLR